MATVTLRGNPVTVGGSFLKKGDAAPDFNLTGADLKDVGLKDYAGKKKVISIVLDENNKVLHSELVPEIGQEPNYDAALAALK